MPAKLHPLPLFTTRSDSSNYEYFLHCITKELPDWAEVQSK